MPNRVTIDARMDRSLAWDMGDSMRYLHVRLEAPTAGEAPERGSMNLALAVDASGSMKGLKLEAAKQAAIGSLAALRDGDRLTLVSFAEDVHVHIAALEIVGSNRLEAETCIRALTCRGMTNLSQGWFQGVLTASGASTGQVPVRAILLSDGQANAGITSAAELSRHAAELLARGVVTTTLGIGDGYDENLLASIAEYGGGRLLDAEKAEDISTVLLAEIKASATTTLDATTLKIRVPHGVQAESLGLNAMTRTLSGIELRIGPLLAGQSRDAVVALRLPRGDSGDVITLPISVDGRDPTTGKDVETLFAEARLTYARSAENSAQPRDVTTSEIVALAWHAKILRRLAGLNRDQAHGEAQNFLKSEVRYFTRYAEGLPEAARLIHGLDLIQRNIGRDWGERTRKEMVYASRRTVMSDTDFRGGDRASWEDQLMSEG